MTEIRCLSGSQMEVENELNSPEDRSLTCVATGCAGDLNLDICTPFADERKYYLLNIETSVLSFCCNCSLDYLFNNLLVDLALAVNSEKLAMLEVGKFNGSDVILVCHDEHVTRHFLVIRGKSGERAQFKLHEQFPEDLYNAIKSAKLQFDTYG